MIKTNELRIGNWFMSAKHDVPFQWQASDFEEAYNTEANPIPLTPEILEKAGFVKGYVKIKSNKENEKCYWLGNFFVLIRSHQNIFAGEKFIDIDYKDSAYSVVIFYVHQLQNLYWCLCGEELEVNFT